MEPESRNPLRRLYNWMLSFADKPSGPRALAAITFAESSFFPIPPDPLLLAMSLGAPKKALRFAAICTVASVLGGIAGYLLGSLFWEALSGFFFTYVPGVSPEAFNTVQEWYQRWDFWAVFLAGITPLPYKVFTLSAGVFQVSFPVFVVASMLSRGLRFFILAGLVYHYGQPIQGFIDRHFERLSWAFGILLVLGFLALRLLG
ncbi:MAG TPA: YqaA family protein [Gemmatimonadales bacterium]|nr:YqaA family protein [Gemmatimonadales bacterium]